MMEALDFTSGVSAWRGVVGEVGDNGDNGEVARGIDRSEGISDIRCLLRNRAMNPFSPGPAEAGGLGIGTGTLNLPVSVALDILGTFKLVESSQAD